MLFSEAELTFMLSEYISMEIDLEILDMLMANASAKKEYWSAKVGFEYDGSGGVPVISLKLVEVLMLIQRVSGSQLLESRFRV